MSTYRAYFALEREIRGRGHDVDRRMLVDAFTGGRTDSLRALTADEYDEFIKWLGEAFAVRKEQSWKQTPENRMRRKIYALFIDKMHYTEAAMHAWVEKYSPWKKPLQDHSRDELTTLVTQAERVYHDFLQATANA